MVQNVHGRILLFQKIGFRIARRGGGVKRGELSVPAQHYLLAFPLWGKVAPELAPVTDEGQQ
jgi:hypothetical protein